MRLLLTGKSSRPTDASVHDHEEVGCSLWPHALDLADFEGQNKRHDEVDWRHADRTNQACFRKCSAVCQSSGRS